MNLSEIHEFYALRAAIRRRDHDAGNLKVKGFAYRNHYDFLLREGTQYVPSPLSSLPQLAPRQCFFNALLTAIVQGLPYVEGMAFSPFQDAAWHHAWNVDERGQVVDRTWGVGRAYLGVEFSAQRANEATWDGDASVLQDPRHELLRSPWVREDSPGRVDGLLEKMASDALGEPGSGLGDRSVAEVVAGYRRMAVGRFAA